jgi:hypothetical protein
MPESFYCGAGPVPKGKVRGSAEYCYQNNQVRYWGLHKIDKSIIEAAQQVKKEVDLNTERAKRLRMRDAMKKLINEVIMVNLQMDAEGVRESELKKLRKKKQDIVERRNKLLKKIEKQDKVLKSIEKNVAAEKEIKKDAKKKAPAKKTPAKKTPAKKASAKKTPAKKTPAKKASGSKTVTKKKTKK